jgi:hypothetical protein
LDGLEGGAAGRGLFIPIPVDETNWVTSPTNMGMDQPQPTAALLRANGKDMMTGFYYMNLFL